MKEFYLPSDFFDAPTTRNKGDASPQAIHLAVGEALDVWEQVEQTFAGLFYTFCDGSHAAVRAYGSIMSGGGRGEALDAASVIYFAARDNDSDDRSCLSHLLNKFKSAGGLRNKIAHGTVIRFEVDTRRFGVFLVPPGYNTGKTHAFRPAGTEADPLAWTGTKYRYTSEDIREMRNRFMTLGEKSGAYRAHLHRKHKQTPARKLGGEEFQ